MLLELPTPSREQLNFQMNDIIPQTYLTSVHKTISTLHWFIVQMCGTNWDERDESHIMFHYRGDRMLNMYSPDLFKRPLKFPFTSEAMLNYIDRIRDYHGRLRWSNRMRSRFTKDMPEEELLKAAYSFFKQINFHITSWSDFECGLKILDSPTFLHFTYTPQYKVDRLYGLLPGDDEIRLIWMGSEGYDHLANHTFVNSPLQNNYPANIHYPFVDKLTQFFQNINKLLDQLSTD